MSDHKVIADVTTRLRTLLESDAELGQNSVRTDHLNHLANGDNENPKLNLYLFQVLPNAARMNPGGEPRPLAVTLRYLLTAVWQEQTKAQEHLGAAMLALHENPILNPGGNAVAPHERAYVTLHPLSVDEAEKLWTGITTPRRLSVAYEVSALLLESRLPRPTPSPVLSRGPKDAIPVLVTGYPTIERIEIGDRPFDEWLRRQGRSGRTVGAADDFVTLHGHDLEETFQAILVSTRQPEGKPMEMVGAPTTDKVTIKLTDAFAGQCAIRLRTKSVLPEADPDLAKDGKRIVETNAAPLAIGLQIERPSAADKKLPDVAAAGDVLSIAFRPPLLDGQKPLLLIGGRQLAAQAVTEHKVADFELAEVPSGKHLVRLRVDGIDSHVVDLDAYVKDETPPVYWPPLIEVTS